MIPFSFSDSGGIQQVLFTGFSQPLGKLAVIDFKTSKGFYDGYDMQIAAYAYAYAENTGREADEIGILRLDKLTGEPFYKDYTKKREAAFDTFCFLLQFYYRYKKRRLKNNPFVGEK